MAGLMGENCFSKQEYLCVCSAWEEAVVPGVVNEVKNKAKQKSQAQSDSRSVCLCILCMCVCVLGRRYTEWASTRGKET